MMQVIENKGLKVETLKKRTDFLRVAGANRKWVTPTIVVQTCVQPEKDNETIRIGYTASKKVGNAVRRNHAKRRMREVVKKVMTVSAEKNHDYVLIARKEIAELPFNELIRDLKWALKRLHKTAGKSGSRNN